VSARRTPRGERGGPRLLLGIAALLWLASMVLPLTTRGTGSALPGHALADLASAGRLPDRPRWLGTAWYLMPIGAAVMLASLGLTGPLASAVRWTAAATAAASALIFTVLVTHLDIARFGAGAWTAIAGSGAAACACGLTALQHLKGGNADVLL
jgi:hypothetical protein